MASDNAPSPMRYEDLDDSIQELISSVDDESILTNDSPLARLPRVPPTRSEAGRLARPASSPQLSAGLLVSSGPPHHDGDDETDDGLLTDSMITFNKSIFVCRYMDGDDYDDVSSRTKFDPSQSVLHDADLYVLWYALFEYLSLGPVRRYAWIFGLVFCVWLGLWLLVRWAERRVYYSR
ncbi:hypothetical protein EYB25_009522 [Talaromyces marneffei]|nr:hypothetical protein EYB25_009522 [Talaromyces marneffei]